MHSELRVNIDYHQARFFPNFGRPKVIGYISLENLKFASDISERKVNFDLNLHLDKAIHHPEDRDVKLTELLNFLLEYKLKLNIPLSNSLDQSLFFCYRGLLTCIACTPYENREPWKIVAILFKGNIYLCSRDTEKKKTMKKNMSEKDKIFGSWGYKFEQFLLSNAPNEEPNPDQPVDETEEFSLVYSTQLNKHHIIYGAEMDGILNADKSLQKPMGDFNEIVDYLANKQFVEFKTSRHIEFPNQERNFRRFKTIKWWCQSFLVGIDTILCGFRNDQGIVEELKTFEVKSLPKMSKRFWDPNVCFNFVDKFLHYVKRCISKELENKYGKKSLKELQSLPLTSLMFEWNPGEAITVNENYNHNEDPILADWFVNNFVNSKD